MVHKNFRSILGIAVLAAAGFLLGVWRFGALDVLPDLAPTRVLADERTVSPPAPVPFQPPSKAPLPDPLSLAALAEKGFDGRDLKIGNILASNEAYVRRYITYMSGPLMISGIMNIPRGKGPFPLLILNHGYIDPKIYTNGRGLKREQDYLARRGYVVVHADYRGHAQSSPNPAHETDLRLGYAEDAVNAVLAVKKAKLPYVDAERVGMLGHSMGGGVTMNAMVVAPELIGAAVLFAPVSADMRDNFRRWIERRPEVAAEIIAAHGGPDENDAFWDGVSPITHLDRMQAPILLHHGTKDDSVPHAWSERLNDALKAANREVVFHSYPDEPHEFIKAWPLVMRRTVEFFDQRLKK